MGFVFLPKESLSKLVIVPTAISFEPSPGSTYCLCHSGTRASRNVGDAVGWWDDDRHRRERRDAGGVVRNGREAQFLGSRESVTHVSQFQPPYTCA